MPNTVITSEALIHTTQGAVYVLQLAEHWAHRFEVRVTANGTIITLSEVTIITLRTAAEGITIRIDTSDATCIAPIQATVFDVLAEIAHGHALVTPVWSTLMT
ncbi:MULTISPECIES: DUF2218 domain-containing protein [Asticcacaulis]|uniref:DUF2218 domain-containing protein n=1 Tax=Asticcacaulis TaxID=76890 RepID=UPI001AE5272D|nr:DUF2218 domain-containing protein [Asticcacaulis sp. BE141]MBP2158736.1 hypothetical protein [Asticcacaulis solisilvae]MDR6799782.1 hypothetical protein [Asticcacaulis sp. BE141]